MKSTIGKLALAALPALSFAGCGDSGRYIGAEFKKGTVIHEETLTAGPLAGYHVRIGQYAPPNLSMSQERYKPGCMALELYRPGERENERLFAVDGDMDGILDPAQLIIDSKTVIQGLTLVRGEGGTPPNFPDSDFFASELNEIYRNAMDSKK